MPTRQKPVLTALLVVLFVSLGLLVIVVLAGLITKTLDPQATVLVLGGIVSGIIAGLVAKGGGES